MTTAKITTTSTFQQISAAECLIQKVGGRDIYVSYADALPTDFNNCHILSHSDIVRLPAPTSGAIYAASTSDSEIIVSSF